MEESLRVRGQRLSNSWNLGRYTVHICNSRIYTNSLSWCPTVDLNDRGLKDNYNDNVYINSQNHSVYSKCTLEFCLLQL